MKSKRILVLFAISVAAILAVATFYILAQNGIALKCLFYRFTGLQCPGCGNSRALLSLLRLDFSNIFRYNLLFPLEAGYLLWVLLRCCYAYLRTGYFSYKPLHWSVDTAILVLVLIWGIVRNVI